MNRFPSTPTRCAAMAAALAAAAFGATLPARAADIACHPDISVDNDKPAAIKVLRLEYTVGGKTYTEGLANKKLAKDQSGSDDQHTWKKQKLQHAAEGLVITATRIEYKDDNTGSGDGFGKAKWSKSFPHSGTCKDTTTYSHVIG